MKKKSYKRPIAILIAVIGAYHVVLFALHPTLPPVAKTEISWGEANDTPLSVLQRPAMDASWCTVTKQPSDEKKDEQDKVPNMATVSRVRFEYRPEASEFMNTGSAAQIRMAQGSSLTIGKYNYPLRQIEFRKSDITGKINLYLIHRIKDGRSAIVSIPLKIGEQSNPAIDALWRYLPKQQGDHNALDDLHLDISHLLPQDHSYYRYPDNGTCPNGTILLGLSSPVSISTAQLLKLDKVLLVQKQAKAF